MSSFPERTCYSASRSVVSWQPPAISSFKTCSVLELRSLCLWSGPSANDWARQWYKELAIPIQHGLLELAIIALCSLLGWQRKHRPLTCSILLTPLFFYRCHSLRKPFLLHTLSHHQFPKEPTYRILSPVTYIILFYPYNNWGGRDSKNSHALLYKWKNWNPGHLSNLTMFTLLGCTKAGLETFSKPFPSLVLFTLGNVKKNNEWQQKVLKEITIGYLPSFVELTWGWKVKHHSRKSNLTLKVVHFDSTRGEL